MAKPAPKNFRRSGHPAQRPRVSSIIPGLGVDVPELQQARALWQINRFDEALELFERAVRKYPQNLVALVDTSRALGARFEITRAEAIVDRLTKVAARKPELLHLAGQSYRMIFRPDKAIECFERVLTQTRQIPDAQLELAVLYERRHRLAEAQVLIEDCLRAAPDYLEAELFKGRLLRRLKESVAAAALFRKLAGNEEGIRSSAPRPGPKSASNRIARVILTAPCNRCSRARNFCRPRKSPCLPNPRPCKAMCATWLRRWPRGIFSAGLPLQKFFRTASKPC